MSGFSRVPREPVRVALVNQAFVPPGMNIGETGAHLPALGLLMLASTIEECDPQMRGKIGYFDEEFLGEEGCRLAVTEFLSQAETGIVMLTTYTMTHHRQISFFDEMKKQGFITMAGGPHVTIHPETSNADYIVRGEGVSVMREIFPWTGTMPETAPGLISQSHDGLSTHPSVRIQRKLSPALWPNPSFAFHLLPREISHRASHKRNLNGLSPLSIVLSKGCPSACHFCTSGAQNGKWATRPLDRFENDLKHMLEHHDVEAIEFHDDDLLAHPEIDGILLKMRALGIPWTCYSRVNSLVGPEGKNIAKRLYDAGCRRVFLGLEAMDNHRLSFLGKQATVSDNLNAVNNLHASSVEIAAAWIIGLPDDNVGSLNEELEVFLSLPLYSLDVNILNLNPGAPLSKKIAKGKIPVPGQDNLNDANALLPNPTRFGAQEPYGQPTICWNMTKQELNEYAKNARSIISRSRQSRVKSTQGEFHPWHQGVPPTNQRRVLGQ